MRGSACAGTGEGVNPGPIWPCLALFTPSGEAGNGAIVASFGPPFTRKHGASGPHGGPGLSRQEWPGVAKLLKPSHFLSFPLIPLVDGGDGRQGCEVPDFAETTTWIRVNDTCNHCKGRRGDGARGICRKLSHRHPTPTGRHAPRCAPYGRCRRYHRPFHRIRRASSSRRVSAAPQPACVAAGR